MSLIFQIERYLKEKGSDMKLKVKNNSSAISLGASEDQLRFSNIYINKLISSFRENDKFFLLQEKMINKI